MTERRPGEKVSFAPPAENADGPTEKDQPFGRLELQEDEVSLDDVRCFIDDPRSLPAEKIPSLVKYYGHVGEIAERLMYRNDCPPEAISTTCQLHGNNPELAEMIIKRQEQLTDEDNRYLHKSNRHDWSLTVNHLYYQKLPADVNWEIYDDHPDDRYILRIMAQCQPELDPSLVRRFYADHRHKPATVADLIIGQKLPEDIVRKAFADYKSIPEFVAVLFRHQKDLPADLVAEAYSNWDRSFEPVLADNSVSGEVFGTLVADVIDPILPEGGIAIDLNTMRPVRIGPSGSGPRDVPGEIFDQAHQEYQSFMNFVLDLLGGNQFDEGMVQTVYDELGKSLAVAIAIFGSQQSIPLDVIHRGCEDHGQDIMFIGTLFENQKDLPRDVIEPLYKRHRWSPLFNGRWLANQSNLNQKEREEASNWRPVASPEVKSPGQPKKLGGLILSLSGN